MVTSDVFLMRVLFLVELWRGKVLVAFARCIVILWHLSAPLVSALLLSFLLLWQGSASQQSCVDVIPPLDLPLVHLLPFSSSSSQPGNTYKGDNDLLSLSDWSQVSRDVGNGILEHDREHDFSQAKVYAADALNYLVSSTIADIKYCVFYR